MQARSRPIDTVTPRLAWLVPCAIAFALVLRHLLASGTWLDEYWQSWISGAPAAQLSARLVADAHPPWFNLLGRAILWLSASDIVAARIANLALASAALAGGLWLLKELDASTRWRLWLLVVASGGIAGMTELAASFRVYPWLLVLAALQAAVLLSVALRVRVQPVLAAIVTAASVAVHYVHAGGAIAIGLVTLAVALRRSSPAFKPVLAGLAAGIALDLVTGLLQLPHWRANFDANWIAANGGGAVASFGLLLAQSLLLNPVTAVLLAAALIFRRNTAALLLAPAPLAAAAWLLLDAGAHLVVPRYLASVTALLAAAAAASWTELGFAAPLNLLAALLAAFQPLLSSLQRPPLPGWEPGARLAGQVERACPAAPLYAVSAWRFRDDADSRTARFEAPVEAFAYREVGRKVGVHPVFVTRPTLINLGDCPAILWMEAAHGVDRLAPSTVLARARLELATPASARFIPTPNGALLLISRPDRLQRGR